jgi:hypothetical protein
VLCALAIAGSPGAAWLLAGGDISLAAAAFPLRSTGLLAAGQNSGVAPLMLRIGYGSVMSAR